MKELWRATMIGVALSVVAALFPSAALTYPSVPGCVGDLLRAHDGLSRQAYLILSTWYGPLTHPAIPLVISPHGVVSALWRTSIAGEASRPAAASQPSTPRAKAGS